MSELAIRRGAAERVKEHLVVPVPDREPIRDGAEIGRAPWSLGEVVGRDRVRRRQESESAALFGGRKGNLLVRWLDIFHRRFNPDLQQMHWLVFRRVELAVLHARAGSHALQLAGMNDRAVAHAVLVFQRSFQNVGDDLHVAMAVPVIDEHLSKIRAGGRRAIRT